LFYDEYLPQSSGRSLIQAPEQHESRFVSKPGKGSYERFRDWKEEEEEEKRGEERRREDLKVG